MDKKAIKAALSEYDQVKVDNYIAYLSDLESAVDKDKKKKNPWFAHRQDDYLVRIFKAVVDDGLDFDGKDVTLQSTGVSYGYQAYKNKMLQAYPESTFDPGLVYRGDDFKCWKESGRVRYVHNQNSPFDRKDADIIGAYIVIKNSRGEFITTLTRDDIEKHKKIAKTATIWNNWFAEMALKTVVKKGCKQHFRDTFKIIEEYDNENYEPELLDDIKLSDENIKVMMDVCREKNFPPDKTLAALAKKWGFGCITDVPASMYAGLKKDLDEAQANEPKAK